MNSQKLLIVLAACLTISFGSGRSAVAQTAASDQAGKAEKPDSAAPKDAQAKDAKTEDPTEKFRGDLWTRKKLTGDWGGARTDLFNHGLDIDLRLTQYYQGVAKGGSNTNFAYGGKFDIILNLDGHKAGLWEGFFVNVHAETQFGNDIETDAGSLSLSNTAMLFHKPCNVTLRA